MTFTKTSGVPLAQQLRPLSFSTVLGQEHLIGKEGVISKIIASKRPLSLLLWGPPGCGKTTIAKLYGQAFGLELISINPTSTLISDLKKQLEERFSKPLLTRQLILFVDEIHRFNRAQQDYFLPLVESGSLILIGATTENPSFFLTGALLSRLRVFTLNPLSNEALAEIVKRTELQLTEEAQQLLLKLAAGDGRYLCNCLEGLSLLGVSPLHPEHVESTVQRRLANYDHQADGHYNLISALHKAIRTSDPDASLYYLARMLTAGEDPYFLARRLLRVASEDIGLADPDALQIALHAWQAYERLGSPEGELALAEATVYLALAPKSNALYTAYLQVVERAKETAHLPPPKHLLNAPTSLMKAQGYGKGYEYDHDDQRGCSGQKTFPEGMEAERYYIPKARGFEREMEKRLRYFSQIRSTPPLPTHQP